MNVTNRVVEVEVEVGIEIYKIVSMEINYILIFRD